MPVADTPGSYDMNDSNASDDRETAAGIGRRAAVAATSGPRRQVPGDSPCKARVLLRGSRALPGILLMVAISPIPACSGTPEQRAFDIADKRAEWLDQFSVDKRACASRGGVIVQERHQPDPIRVGDSRPEVGTRYYCRYEL